MSDGASSIGRELRRLGQSASFVLRERGVSGIAREIGDITWSYASYPVRSRRWARETFTVNGRELRYVRHHYNRAWRNERSVELSLGLDFLARTPPGRTLEVGHVLGHYGVHGHDVLDKYERSPGVLNEDIVDFEPAEPYDRVVSISTLEHVGWDERPREPDKVLRAYKNLRAMLRPGGDMLVTCPIGQNPHLDEYIADDELDFPVRIFLKRVSADNRWVQVDKPEVRGASYGSPWRNANALFVGVVPGDAAPLQS